jgi:hypothetical protein
LFSGKVFMSNHDEELGHGHSTAAWTSVITTTVGVAIATFGVCLPEGNLLIVGSVVTVLGAVLGPILAKLGYGAAGKTGSTK